MKHNYHVLAEAYNLFAVWNKFFLMRDKVSQKIEKKIVWSTVKNNLTVFRKLQHSQNYKTRIRFEVSSFAFIRLVKHEEFLQSSRDIYG